MRSQEQQDRLIKLRDFMKTLDPKRFDLTYWINCPGDNKGPVTTAMVRKGCEKGLTDCGTTACLLGWCTVLFPEFKLQTHPLELLFNGEEVDPDTLDTEDNGVTDFFGITKKQIYELASNDFSSRSLEDEIHLLDDVIMTGMEINNA